jgi:hypothetical protein
MMMNPMTIWEFLTWGFVCWALGVFMGRRAKP